MLSFPPKHFIFDISLYLLFTFILFLIMCVYMQVSTGALRGTDLLELKLLEFVSLLA